MEVELKVHGDKTERGVLPCLLPEDILTYLLRHCQLTIPEEECKTYWNHLEAHNDEQARLSQAYRNLQDRQVWPLGLHGDEASVQLVVNPYDKIIGVTMNLPLWRPKTIRASRWLLFCIESPRLASAQTTLFPLLQRIVESLNKCTEEGILGRTFIVSELRGDQAWFKHYLFHHVSWWKATHICCRCEATTASCSHIFTSYDGWIPTRKGTQHFLEKELPLPMSCLGLKLLVLGESVGLAFVFFGVLNACCALLIVCFCPI